MDNEIRMKLVNHLPLSNTECFALAGEISNKLNSTDDTIRQVGRDIIILLFDNIANVPDTYMELFGDLLSAAGFYPYLTRFNTENSDFDDQIRIQYHKSTNLDDKFFHSEQKKIVDLIHQKRNVIVSAPTSFGKSMLIEEIIASKEYKNIVIIQPTLALLDETRRKLKKYANNYKIIVKTSQQFEEARGNIFLLTAERVLEYPNMPQIQLLILDEFYKLSNVRGDNRNNVLNTAFIRIMKNPSCRFYMLGPNVDSIPDGFTEKYNAIFFKTNFSMVLTETENKYDSVKKKSSGKVDEEDLFTTLDQLNEQTLIYCSSPKIARRLAFSYCKHLATILDDNIPFSLPLTDWINQNLSYRWSLAKCLQYGIAVHDGAMPKHITSSTIQYFNQHKIKFLFCTNTIIEGVNTSAKNVVYYDNKIGKREIDYFDYSNIRGRAGRLMEHYVGKIVNLQKPPLEAKTNVDFPFFVQNPIASEVLVNLEEQDVKDVNDNIHRYKEFHKKDPELQTILKRNAVSIEGQERILSQLFQDLSIPAKRELILWNKIDGKLYNRLTYIFDLCWDNLSTEDERKSFGPKGWIVNKIVGSCFQTSINTMIDKDIEYKAKKLAEEKKIPFHSVDNMFKQFPVEMQDKIDNIIETMFALQKNWLQYRAPKWINVVDSLQKYASKQLDLPAGDYAYVAEMIENEFIQTNFRILLEYGVPRSAIQKLQVMLTVDSRMKIANFSEDEIISLLSARKQTLKQYLSEYEFEIIERAL